MEVKKIIFLISIFSLLVSNEKNSYRIHYLGMHVADCIIEYSDTTLILEDSEFEAVNIEVDVSTTGVIDKIFQVNNDYKLIIDKKNGNLIDYTKNSYQPNVTNCIKTSNFKETSKGNYILYEDNDHYTESHKTIFSIFYLLTHNKDSISFNNNFILEREAKLYTANIQNKIKNKFIINIKEKSSDIGVVKHTDIFSWAIFMEDGEKTIYLNDKGNRIEKCIFKKGWISLTAEYYE